MMLRREMRAGSVVYKQRQKECGCGTHMSQRVFLGGCDKRHSMMGNNLIWADVSDTYLSILGHFGFKGAFRTIEPPRSSGLGL